MDIAATSIRISEVGYQYDLRSILSRALRYLLRSDQAAMVLTRRAAAAQSRKPEGADCSTTALDMSKNVTNTSAGSNLRQMILLATLAAGICSCYLFYGIVQERLFSKSSAHGQAVRAVGPITTFLVLTQCVGNTAVALLWTWVQQNMLSRGSSENNGKNNTSSAASATTLNHKLLLLTAFCYFGAMTCSNESINHVSYPTVVLAKSSKLIPAMLAGVLIERKSYTAKEWVGALLITSGVVVFNWTRLNEKAVAGGDGDSPFGLLLLLVSLAMDGALSSCQGFLKRSSGQYRPPTAMEFMLFTNTYSFFFLLPACAWSGQLHNGMTLFLEGGADAATARKWIYLLNATAAGGQVFIFLTIHCFSSLMCTTITTTRKFCSILLSVRHFGHVFTGVQWGSICMVFGGLYIEIVAKLKGSGGKEAPDRKKKE